MQKVTNTNTNNEKYKHNQWKIQMQKLLMQMQTMTNPNAQSYKYKCKQWQILMPNKAWWHGAGRAANGKFNHHSDAGQTFTVQWGDI